jgi:hypothetical protein
VPEALSPSDGLSKIGATSASFETVPCGRDQAYHQLGRSVGQVGIPGITVNYTSKKQEDAERADGLTDLTSWSDDQKPARIREHHQDPISTDLGDHATSLITVILVDVVADICSITAHSMIGHTRPFQGSTISKTSPVKSNHVNQRYHS